MTTVVILSICLILCLVLSAFFSGSEMAFSSANIIRLENLKDKGNKKAAKALYIAEHFDDALSAILIGNNLVNIASSSIGSVIVFLVFGDGKWTWLSTLIITVAVIIFGETIPKIKSTKRATSKAIEYSAAVRILMVLLKPAVVIVVFLINFITLPFKGHESEQIDDDESVEELQSIIETAEDEGILDEDDTEIVSNAIDFADISASEAMTARVDVQAIDIDDSFEDILKFIEETPFSRIPVYQDSIDNVIGVLHLNKFLQALSEEKQAFDIKRLLNEPCYVYKTMKLPTVLSLLKKARQHLAIVTDEYSGTLGIITMEDVLEQIVGDIWDETDIIEKDVIVKNENTFVVDGDLPISEFLELIQLSEDEFEYESETVGGWAVEMLEKFPDKGDCFSFKDYEIKVTSVDGRRVEKLLVKKDSGF